MKKPQKQCEIRLQKDDVLRAIEDWLNDNQYSSGNVKVSDVTRTRSRKYMIIAKFK